MFVCVKREKVNEGFKTGRKKMSLLLCWRGMHTHAPRANFARNSNPYPKTSLLCSGTSSPSTKSENSLFLSAVSAAAAPASFIPGALIKRASAAGLRGAKIEGQRLHACARVTLAVQLALFLYRENRNHERNSRSGAALDIARGPRRATLHSLFLLFFLHAGTKQPPRAAGAARTENMNGSEARAKTSSRNLFPAPRQCSRSRERASEQPIAPRFWRAVNYPLTNAHNTKEARAL